MREATNDDVVAAVDRLYDVLIEIKEAVDRMNRDVVEAIQSLEGTTMLYGDS